MLSDIKDKKVEKKIIMNKKCIECKKYYTCEMFNGYCSKCYKNMDYKDWYDKVGIHTTHYYSDYELDIEINKNRIEDNSKEWTMMKKVWSNQSIGNPEIFHDVLNHLYVHTTYKGISCKQAIELWKLFCQGCYVKKDLYWKYSHLLCGFIIDRWNIKLFNCNIGPSSCYYMEKKPIKNYFIEPAVINTYTMGLLYNKKKRSNIFDTWKKSIPLKL
tara:strand:+ start:40 stop:684 length:645 start_codon:yes stop_codon:yes gene_type:complete